VADPASRRARRRRKQLFLRLMRPQAGDRVVDVGCGEGGQSIIPPGLEVCGVDNVDRPAYAQGSRTFLKADARALPFADDEFEIAFSNSVIEHIVDPADRARYAAEIRRVARRYFVQTPNRFFPVEPHSLLPLVHLLPPGLGRRLWRFGVSTDPYQSARLLGAKELRRLFPDAAIVRERVGPLTKSLVVAGPVESPATRRRGP
jgi:SAM-dependent methyltransferase